VPRPTRSPSRRLPAVGLVLALAALLAAPACGQQPEVAVAAASTPPPSVPSSTPSQSKSQSDSDVERCVDLAVSDLSYDGRTYAHVGYVPRLPPASPVLGTGTRPVSHCTGQPATARVEVTALEGTPPEQAVLVHDELFVAGPVPEQLRALTDPAACATPGVFTLVGAWKDTDGYTGKGLGPPYTILFETDGGQGLPAYDHTQLDVRVTRSTDLPGRKELGRLQGTDEPVTLRVRCDGAAFHAEQVR